jgi:hypothetical protein
MPSRQIQYNKSQLILTLDLEHNRTSGLRVAEKRTQCFDIGNFFAFESSQRLRPGFRIGKNHALKKNPGQASIKINDESLCLFIVGLLHSFWKGTTTI